MAKAIALLSGGLDSTLAVKLMLEQGIEVLALSFVTPFCTCTKQGCQNEAKQAAEKFGIALEIIGLKEDYIKIVKDPRHGYGRNMNPCIDCRIFMFRRARAHMENNGAAFVFTGEVLGERPMSQHLNALRLIEMESGLEGRLLRPLSARLLSATEAEKVGIVDRDMLLAISGRSRKPQIALAREKSIFDYPCPAGGCRLTDANYARRLKDAFAHAEDSWSDIVLLRYGRHYRLPSGKKVIVGRNEAENEILQNAGRTDHHILLEVRDHAGPVALLRGGGDADDVRRAAELCLAHSDYAGLDPARVRVGDDAELCIEPGSAPGNGARKI